MPLPLRKANDVKTNAKDKNEFLFKLFLRKNLSSMGNKKVNNDLDK